MVDGNADMQAGNASIGPLRPAHGYLAAARALLPALHVLARSSEDVTVARALLASHALECALKSYLAHAGVAERDLRDQSRRHNLETLWREAANAGLALQQPAPPWCITLNTLHDSPFHLRYPLRVHGLVLPGSEPLTAELQSVVDTVSATVR